MYSSFCMNIKPMCAFVPYLSYDHNCKLGENHVSAVLTWYALGQLSLFSSATTKEKIMRLYDAGI